MGWPSKIAAAGLYLAQRARGVNPFIEGGFLRIFNLGRELASFISEEIEHFASNAKQLWGL